MEIIKKIKQLIEDNKLTPKEQILAHYVLENTRKIPELNMNQLANSCGASTGTIQRLIRKLNLEGFTDFKQKLLKDSFKSYQSTTVVKVESDSPYQDLFQKISDKSQKQVIELINKDSSEFKNGVLKQLYSKYLKDADNIVVLDYDDNFGHSLSQLLLEQNYFNKYLTSINKTEKTLKCSQQTLERKKKVLESRFKERMEVFKMIDFSSLFSKDNFFNNLLIITSIEEYNMEIENLAKKAKDMDFNVLIFYNGEQESFIKKSLYDMSLNLGWSISIEGKSYESKLLTPQSFLEIMNVFYEENIK